MTRSVRKKRGVNDRGKSLALREVLERGLSARFEVADALDLGQLGVTFDTVIDSGLFHVFDDEGRAGYVTSLASVLRSGGTCYLACFSDLQPGTLGPRRVHQDEIVAAFSDGWTVTGITGEEFEVNAGPKLRDAARTLSKDRSKDLAHDILDRQKRISEQHRQEHGMSIGR